MSVALSGQEATKFKDLYAQADYERALGALTSPKTADEYEYKALCLLALGRTDDVSAAVKDLVSAFPLFTPPRDEVPPKFEDLVTTTRRALLPTIAKQAFADGREHFGKKQQKEAIDRFSLVLTLAADPAFEDRVVAKDLSTLAQGFIELARATTLPPKPSAADRQAAAAATAPPRPASPKVTQATARVQSVPPIPEELIDRATGPLVLLVRIDETGSVIEALVQQSLSPQYDRLVVAATRGWRYTPATRDGVAVASEQLITIQPSR
jgi:TonB family protein